MNRLVFITLVVVGASAAAQVPAAAPEPAPMPAVVAGYVDEAFQANLALQGRVLDVEQARARLTEARSAYQPRVDLLARYSRADGGRTIDVPTGDLLNGVYRTLNDLLQSQGQPPQFAQISNQSIPLLREREQETKLRLTQPLYRPQIARGVRARRADVAAREAQLAAYRRELRFSVLAGYYSYLQAESAVSILEATSALTTEAVRVNGVLRDADRATEDQVLRAEADDLAVQQQRAEAERDRNHARAYFNFLLNRPLTTPIERASEDELHALTDALLVGVESTLPTPDGREELVALHHAISASAESEAAVRARQLPTLDLAIEGGIQGERYRTGSDANFVQGSLVAGLNIWDGRERRSQREQARVERTRAELQLEETRHQLELQVERASDELTAATLAYRAAARRREAATRTFDLVAQREREGLVNQLNFLDARNELTNAELNFTITRQRLLIAAAALDRAAALTPLP